VNSQENPIPRQDKNFRLELEPASVFLQGFAASVTYNVTKYKDFNVGIYGASLNLPKWVQADMFSSVGDTTDIRLGMELAVMARFKLNVFKERESNPYVGTILGWEYFDISQPNQEKLRIKTGIFTPYVGYEIYLYKQMVYLNPQIRGVYYFSTQTEDASRSEILVDCYLLPQLAIGLRL
jgi:hypothetical protein